MTSFLPISGRPMGFTNMSVGYQKCPMSDQTFVAPRENGSQTSDGPSGRHATEPFPHKASAARPEELESPTF